MILQIEAINEEESSFSGLLNDIFYCSTCCFGKLVNLAFTLASWNFL